MESLKEKIERIENVIGEVWEVAFFEGGEAYANNRVARLKAELRRLQGCLAYAQGYRHPQQGSRAGHRQAQMRKAGM